MMKKLNLWLLLGILMSLSFISCKDDDPVDSDNPSAESEKENIQEQTYFANFIDNSIYVGDDFYLYGVNNWIKAHPLAEDEYVVSVQGEQRINAQAALKQIASGKVGNDPVITQLIACYNKIDFTSDVNVLNAKLADIDAASSKEDVYKKMAQLMKNGYVAPFVYALFSYEREVKLALTQPKSILDIELTASILKGFTGMSEAEASKIVKAGNNWNKYLKDNKLVSARNRESRQAPPILVKKHISKTRGGFSTIYQELGLPSDFWSSDETDKMMATFEAYDVDTQKALLKYFIVNRDLNFIIVEKEDATDAIMKLFNLDFSILNTLVSRVYSETQISPDARQRCIELCQEHRDAFRERIQNLQWMSSATKQKAIEKLDEMQLYVGWPDNMHPEWEVQPVDAPTGYQAVLKLFEQTQTLYSKLIGLKTYDALFYADWISEPAFEANAFHTTQNNAICLLSSNMVPPIFDLSLGEANLYGSLGFTIGHEMTHGFDNTGSKYDKYGKSENWWTSADEQTFLSLQEKMINHFSSLEYYPGLKCDGKYTLDENIADLGGVNISLQAYMKHLEKNGATQEVRDREAREFFRAYAYSWAENHSKEGAEAYQEDTHSEPSLRVNGNVYQLDEFYRVFNIQAGQRAIFPSANRITIW